MNRQSEAGTGRSSASTVCSWIGVIAVITSILVIVCGCASHTVNETSTTGGKPQTPTTSAVTQATGGLTPAWTADGHMGYIDQRGKWVIQPRFGLANAFSEGLASVSVNDRYGYIDPAGHMVISPQFFSARDFSEGFAFVRTSQQSGFTLIDKTGRKISKTTWDFVGAFSEGLAAVGRGGRTGYVDKNGKLAIPLKFEYATAFSEGLAAVRLNGKWGYIDKSGNWVIPPQFGYLTNITDGIEHPLVVVGRVEKDAVGYGAGAFKNGLAPVSVSTSKTNYVFYYIDKTGKKMFGSDYEIAGEFSEGLAPVEIGQKWGYIGVDGRIVIKPQFGGPDRGQAGIWETSKMVLQDGLAPVRLGDKMGYINTAGKLVISLLYPYTDVLLEPFDEGTHTASLPRFSLEDGGMVVINSQGKIIQEVKVTGSGATATTVNGTSG